MMNFFKKLPRFPLLLTSIAYLLLGWYVANASNAWRTWVETGFCASAAARQSPFCAVFSSPYVAWGAVAILVVAIAVALIHPITEIKSVFGNWLQSDTKAFLSAIAIAFFIVILVTRSDLLVEILVLVAPGLLARLEMQLVGYSDGQSFGVLTVVSLLSYSLGLFLHQSLKL
ncbi:MAG: hypothetical protein SW833_00055 [Cyanobacteriota bacterium]|nr:hypothetical protein [Cyanobacteriota bacterium]